MSSPSIDQDKELAEFFTDVEHLRSAFKDAVAAPTLTKRLLVIHGVGGVGKSSLLRMFRLHCKSVNVPVALASGDEAKSAFDILARWTDDLKADGVTFSAKRLNIIALYKRRSRLKRSKSRDRQSKVQQRPLLKPPQARFLASAHCLVRWVGRA